MAEYLNGGPDKKVLGEIRNDVKLIRDHVATAINDLSNNVAILSSDIKHLSKTLETSIPMKAVMWMFGVMVLVIAGVKGIEAADRFFTLFTP